MWKTKPGVDISGIRPEMVYACSIIHEIYKSHGIDFVVTSVSDGRHSRGSLHYVGLAIDCRIRNIPSKDLRSTIYKQIKESLGEQFDVVYHSTHFHVEFQPK